MFRTGLSLGQAGVRKEKRFTTEGTEKEEEKKQNFYRRDRRERKKEN